MTYGDDHPTKQQLRCFDQEHQVLKHGFAVFSMNRAPGQGAPGEAQVYYDTDYLRKIWGSLPTHRGALPLTF